jgi:hypothetical protein
MKSELCVFLHDAQLSRIYEGESKIFRTGAAIYTEVVVARNTRKWQEFDV